MIKVEVVYATGKFVDLIPLSVPDGTTVGGAIARSGVKESHPDALIDDDNLGIFSRPCTSETVLRDGDRVEIYRPLRADPKDARRLRAERQKKSDTNAE